MAEAIYLSTIGVHLKYAVEQEAGERPTTGYKDIPGIKNIPSMNPAPDNLETTTLNETEYKTYIPGLKDLGGALPFLFNVSQVIKDTWEQIVTEYETAVASGKRMWFLVDVPGLTDGLYFPRNSFTNGITRNGCKFSCRS